MPITRYIACQERQKVKKKMSDNASASCGSDQGPSSRQHTVVSSFKLVLKQILMADKSMQLLKNLQYAESTTCQAAARGTCSVFCVFLDVGTPDPTPSCHPDT
ncbi:Gamma-tubulin complex component 5 [Saguinus oedipus]|uniref:Gamma-tubulin complex component 5 n=1 Tax=Saguinus oedipus TaxID=9490 RepID=A0ABQ9TAJ4_SAGOE|nr:Gamma-tubulin complex component 5 [Saguinus oedipus]